MNASLYQKHIAVCIDLEKRGYLGIVGMAKIMQRPSEMSRALGFASSGAAASKWLTGANNPSFASDQKARDWLAKNSSAARQEVVIPAPRPPVPQIIALEAKKTLLLVTCAPAERKRVEKILAMLDCEVVEV